MRLSPAQPARQQTARARGQHFKIEQLRSPKSRRLGRASHRTTWNRGPLAAAAARASQSAPPGPAPATAGDGGARWCCSSFRKTKATTITVQSRRSAAPGPALARPSCDGPTGRGAADYKSGSETPASAQLRHSENAERGARGPEIQSATLSLSLRLARRPSLRRGVKELELLT